MNKHVIIINRWVDEYAQYEKYVDHKKYDVTYVATKAGIKGVPKTAARAIQVDETDDWDSVYNAALKLSNEFGVPESIVALYEDDTIIAAQLRERFGCKGPNVKNTTKYRDKLYQAITMERNGIKSPRFSAVNSIRDILNFAELVGYPLVIKPTLASSCVEVYVLHDVEEVNNLILSEKYNYIAQEFIDFPIYNLDGLYSNGEIQRIGVSRYFSTCLEFQKGGFLGSIEIDESPRRRGIVNYAEKILKAMCSIDETITFHIEIFVDHNAMPGKACTFLEMGARVGGAGIPFIWREVYNYDIMWMQYELSCGRGLSSIPINRESGRAGWLLIQLPDKRPCQVVDITSMIGQPLAPYAEAIPKIGQIIPLTNTYFEHVAARFRIKGRNFDELFSIMMNTIDKFSIETSKIVA